MVTYSITHEINTYVHVLTLIFLSTTAIMNETIDT